LVETGHEDQMAKVRADIQNLQPDTFRDQQVEVLALAVVTNIERGVLDGRTAKRRLAKGLSTDIRPIGKRTGTGEIAHANARTHRRELSINAQSDTSFLSRKARHPEGRATPHALPRYEHQRP